MVSEHTVESSNGYRRELLQGLAGTGLLLTAGCIGDDPEGNGGSDENGNGGADTQTNDTDTQTDEANESDTDGNSTEALTFTDIFNPPDLQYNWLNPSESGATEWSPGEILYDRFLLYTPQTDEYHTESFIFDDWELNGDTLTVEISDAHYWHDGDQVTAEDVANHWGLEIYSYEATDSEHPYMSEVEQTGEFEVEFTLHDEYNEDLMLQAIFTGPDARLYTKTSLFEEEIEALESADSDDEVESAFADLQQKTIDEPVGNGPFMFDSASEQSLELTLFEDYPTSDGINFESISWRAFSDGQAELQAIEAGEIDVTLAISPQEESIMEQWPAGLETPRIDMPQFGGRALAVQHDHEILGITEVRKAFAHIINRDNIAVNTPENVTALELPPSGVPEPVADQWLGDLQEDLEPYENDEERATELMESAGFERTDGEWVDEDGTQIQIEIKTHPYADSFVPVAQTAASNLAEFGIGAEVLQLEAAVAESDSNDGNYEMMVADWGGGAQPYVGYLDMFVDDYASAANVPEEFTVPSVGDPEGEDETINTYELVNQMPTQDEDEAEESVRQLAWVVNQELPMLPVSNMFNTGWVFQPDEWEYTTDDEGLMSTHNPAMFGPRMNFLESTGN